MSMDYHIKLYCGFFYVLNELLSWSKIPVLIKILVSPGIVSASLPMIIAFQNEKSVNIFIASGSDSLC